MVAAADEYKAEVVVLSPLLDGTDDLLSKVVVPLRERGIRVVFLPGSIDMPDCREWVRKLVPYGVYCYVFDPVTPEKIIERVSKPGTLGELPLEIRRAGLEVSVEGLEEAFNSAAELLVQEGDKSRRSSLAAFKVVRKNIFEGVKLGRFLRACLPERAEKETRKGRSQQGVQSTGESSYEPDLHGVPSGAKSETKEVLDFWGAGEHFVADFRYEEGLESGVAGLQIDRRHRSSRTGESLVFPTLRNRDFSPASESLQEADRLARAESPAEQQPSAGSSVANQLAAGRYAREGVFAAGDFENVGAPVVVVSSPVSGGGATSFTAMLARALAQRYKVSVLDCNINRGGLGSRLGVSNTTGHDWRIGGTPLKLGNLLLYPLSFVQHPVDGNRLTSVVVEAASGVDFLVVDAGSDMDSWWFRQVFAVANVVFWVLRGDPVLLERVRLVWENRPAVRCREYAVLLGRGEVSVKLVEEALVLPCFAVKRERDIKEIVRLLKGNLPRGPRLLLAGFRKVPAVEWAVVDAFERGVEAAAWACANPPDLALLCEGSKDVALLEFDLKKMGIPVLKASPENVASVLNLLRGWVGRERKTGI